MEAFLRAIDFKSDKFSVSQYVKCPPRSVDYHDVSFDGVTEMVLEVEGDVYENGDLSWTSGHILLVVKDQEQRIGMSDFESSGEKVKLINNLFGINIFNEAHRDAAK